jgi:spermidine synthase
MTFDDPSRRWQSAGLFLVTFATLVLEVLNTRLLSVLTWYHLSFFAVSIAMLGMSAGAVRVFLGRGEFDGVRVRNTLARQALTFAWLIPLSHVAMLAIPLPDVKGLSVAGLVVLVGSIGILTAPFFASGIVVTLALTRVGGSIGRLYFYDLLGASAGCLAVVVMLNALNITSAAFLAGAAAAGGAYCFARVAGERRGSVSLVLAVGLMAAAMVSGSGYHGIRVRFAKHRPLPPIERVHEARWNNHSFVLVRRPIASPVFYWGAGAKARPVEASLAWLDIDGSAGSAITRWDGRLESLAWVEHDVTNAPYSLRHGDVAVIGVGGGRDILSAIRSGSTRITGVELNGILVDLLQGSLRDFASIADQPGVRLVHDEARSYFSRTNDRFDVLQMSLIDTWASTGAGALTLTENGLYTVEAWRLFLNALKSGGVFSVSRWFSPESVSETTRLLALGVAAILDRGITDPQQHLILLSRDNIATLMCSTARFSDLDRDRVERLAREEQFTILASPWTTAATEQLSRASRAQNLSSLEAAVADPDFDYSPPTDQRPYFFNLLKLGSFMKSSSLPRTHILWGNITATTTLVLLLFIASGLVLVMIVVPLFVAGARGRQIPAFGSAISYFALIGTGYMLIQIPFLQRFSFFLGHPTYTFAVILFSMILFTGIGSFLSERVSIDAPRSRYFLVPLAIGLMILVETWALDPVTAAVTRYGIAARTMAVLVFTAPVSLLLGCCFPIGMRLVERHSAEATAWMWGVNGACGVVASIGAVALSMSIGINASLIAAATLYTLLLLPMRSLARATEVTDGRALADVV